MGTYEAKAQLSTEIKYKIKLYVFIKSMGGEDG
jgi:hypothetical protein